MHYLSLIADAYEVVANPADAIGWALREYGKTNPDSVRHFVGTNTLAALSSREALRKID